MDEDMHIIPVPNLPSILTPTDHTNIDHVLPGIINSLLSSSSETLAAFQDPDRTYAPEIPVLAIILPDLVKALTSLVGDDPERKDAVCQMDEIVKVYETQRRAMCDGVEASDQFFRLEDKKRLLETYEAHIRGLDAGAEEMGKLMILTWLEWRLGLDFPTPRVEKQASSSPIPRPRGPRVRQTMRAGLVASS